MELFSHIGAFALLQNVLPPPVRTYIDRGLAMLWGKLFHTVDPHVEIQVEEKAAGSHKVTVYLSSLRASIDTQVRLKACRPIENGLLSLSLQDNESLEDSFEGVPVWWTHVTTEREGGRGLDYGDSGGRSFTLQFLRADRSIIIPAYLDHVSKVSAEIEHNNTQRCLYTNSYGGWTETPFNHPSTFDSLALDVGMADHIKADLDVFSKGESFYHRNGRAWKRGYLLYGPPGTGKSSMIAAIANYLQYDIYDLELTKVVDNADLKSLLMQTARKSVIVIEDVDCSVKLSDRRPAENSSEAADASDSSTPSKLTLSGLLNFTDGLWSCCGEERIFIFTTNYKDRLDPALLRPGRMDMHILLSYCSFPAFKKLASSYLGIQDHPMYPELEEALTKTPHQITPAAMAEILVSNQSNPDEAFRKVLTELPRHVPAEVVDSAIEESASEASLAGLKKKKKKKGLSKRWIFFSLPAIRCKPVDECCYHRASLASPCEDRGVICCKGVVGQAHACTSSRGFQASKV